MPDEAPAASPPRPPATRDARGRWLPGVVPRGARLFPHQENPAGLPKWVKEIRALAASHGSDAIATLAKIMKNEKEKSEVRVAAACALLDRAGVRPVALEIDKPESTPPVDVEALRLQLAARVVRLLGPSSSSGSVEVTTVDLVAKASGP